MYNENNNILAISNVYFNLDFSNMAIILKSNRKSSGCFSPDDFFIAWKLLRPSIERLKDLNKYCQVIDEKKLKELIDNKAITYVEENLTIFEDKTYILKGDKPIVLCMIYCLEQAGIQYFKKFSEYLLGRIDKIRRIKELNEQIISLLRERKGLELSLFPFTVPEIPSSLMISKEEEFELISKLRIVGNQPITLTAKFYNNLLVATSFLWQDKQIPLRYQSKDDLDLLFSTSFYKDVEKFLDEYPEIEIQESIKTINSLSST